MVTSGSQGITKFLCVLRYTKKFCAEHVMRLLFPPLKFLQSKKIHNICICNLRHGNNTKVYAWGSRSGTLWTISSSTKKPQVWTTWSWSHQEQLATGGRQFSSYPNHMLGKCSKWVNDKWVSQSNNERCLMQVRKVLQSLEQ